MAAFAKIGLNNKVMEVLSVHDNELLDSNGVSHESIGISFLTNLTGWAIWKQSFEDGSSRKNFASINYSYDETRDAFIPPQPYPSWTLNETTCQWKAPTPYPGENYTWNEETLTWENE